MKIQQVIVQHLYSNRQIALPGIGIFRLNSSIAISGQTYKNESLAQPTITFEYNPKVSEDASLVEAIIHYTKKIKPLAHADLDSFLMLETELLNLGIPVTLEGIGTLEQTQQGKLTFLPHQSILTNRETGTTKKNIAVHLISPEALKKISKTKVAFIILIAFSLCLTGWISNYIIKQNTHERNIKSDVKNFTPVTNKTNNSLPGPTESKRITSVKKATDNYIFKIVFFVTSNKEDALKTLYEINGFGHSAIMFTDSSVYKVAIPFKLPLADTFRIKDSLDQFYSLGKGFVEVK